MLTRRLEQDPNVTVLDARALGAAGMELAAQLARAEGHAAVVVIVAAPDEPGLAEASAAPEPTSRPPAAGYETGLWVSGRRGAFRLSLDAVRWFAADRDYVRIRAEHGEHLIRSAMSGLIARLDPTRFLRVHRSAIVNRSRVRGLERQDNGCLAVVLDDGARVGVARRYARTVKAALLAG